MSKNILKNSNKKKLCPQSGSSKPELNVDVCEDISVKDYFQLLAEQNGKNVGFRESEREGRVTAADTNEDGSLSFSITGTSPQGEEDTLPMCRQLITALNKKGANWSEPIEGEGVEDCIAVNRNDSNIQLLIQVVRAIITDELWRELNTKGKYEDRESKVEDLTHMLKAAVAKKSHDCKIPASIRKSLVLALDATILPIMGVDSPTKKYIDLYGDWTKKQGFKEVWLVGPHYSLVKRLDI